MNAPKSNNLFHFTKTRETLQLILRNGFYPRYCLEDIDWMGAKGGHMAYPMVCFCDIPLSRITEHTKFYGSFGIGVTKEWGLKNSLNPVAYFPEGGHLCRMVQNAISIGISEVFMEKHLRDFTHHLYRQMALMKPIEGTMVINGDLVEKEFHQECEWRHVPDGVYLLARSEFEEKKNSLNAEMEAQKLAITPQDIRYIFVKNDADIPPIYDWINTELSHFPLKDIKILISRVTSLETLDRDM